AYDRNAIIATLELGDVSEVALVRKKPTGSKYRCLRLDTEPFGFASLDILKVVDERRYASKARYDRIAHVVVETIATRHRALGIGDEALRRRSEAAQYTTVGNDLVAPLVREIG